MDPVKIVVTRRSGDWHACISGEPGCWGAGSSRREAIGDLVQSHPERFGISAVDDGHSKEALDRARSWLRPDEATYTERGCAER